jgi:hypothetical protein
MLEVHLGGVAVLALGDRLVDEVGDAGDDDHHDAHREDPDQQLDLDLLDRNREEDEGDEGDAGHAVRLEAIGRGTDRVAGIVPGTVGNDAGVARIVFLDLEDDLHQVGADVGDLGEDAAGDAQGGGPERLTNGEADEAGAGVVTRHEQKDAEHQHQLDRDQQHADRHAGLQRDRVGRERLAPERRKGRAGVGVGVDADAEPRDAIAAEDADDREGEDGDDLGRTELLEDAEVQAHDGGDEDPEQRDEAALRLQVGLAGFIDQLGDLPHRAVNLHVLELVRDDQAEDHAEEADDEAAHQQRSAVHPQELHRCEIGQFESGLTHVLGRAGRSGRSNTTEQRCHRQRPRPQGAQQILDHVFWVLQVGVGTAFGPRYSQGSRRM